VWVIQEATVGSNPIFVCGDRAVEWNVMAYAINESLLHGPLARVFATKTDESELARSDPITAATHLIQMCLARAQIKSNKLQSFQEILVDMTAGYEATDLHDRIYGLLGLSSHQEDAELRRDY
jgi:hypothetical protein